MCKKIFWIFQLLFCLNKALAANVCLSQGCFCTATEMEVGQNKSQSNFTVNCRGKNLTIVSKIELRFLGSKPTTINFENNTVYSLHDNLFAAQINLKKVIFRYNFIEDISASAFNVSKMDKRPFISPIEFIDLRGKL